MDNTLFKNPQFNPEQFRQDMKLHGPARTYVIFFTPRSGSSWLTEILTKSGYLGIPEEWLNPNFIPNTSKVVNSDSIANYIKMLKRKRQKGGTFGIEMTYFQYKRSFLNDSEFSTLFPSGTKFFYLVRKDIVSQAVSLAKAVATGVYHSANADELKIEKANEDFKYDKKDIEKWLRHILSMEQGNEELFARLGIEPYRICYEDMTTKGAVATVKFFERSIGISKDLENDIATSHRKIGTEKNSLFAEAFRRDRISFLRSIEKEREVRLSSLSSI